MPAPRVRETLLFAVVAFYPSPSDNDNLPLSDGALALPGLATATAATVQHHLHTALLRQDTAQHHRATVLLLRATVLLLRATILHQPSTALRMHTLQAAPG